MKLEERCRAIELVLSDVDGVLTDGGLIFDNQGIETKKFHIRDGLGIRLWQRAGYRFGILTARTSHIVRLRCVELGIEIVRQGFEDKLLAAQQICEQQGLDLEQICYIGDDLTDIPLVRRVGLGVAVANAATEVCTAAHVVTDHPGGTGAVRELIETLLKAKNRWDDLIRKYVEQ
jgi:YrbI family 3-deoxy-D-manno-octulosonate 8-phosphate phosphatase